ncbi:MAG: [protein-PII] uridylyltransferase [Nitrospirales bacterium]|nr:[protein-PII] uridylyltransferase [Nitrospirales bacterium]
MKEIAKSLCEKASELISSGSEGIPLARHLAAITDNLLTEIFEKGCGNTSDGICLVAVGGYGRGEMAPFSDIDIMFLVRERTSLSEERTTEMLYKLWDTGLTIGHSFRTMKDCVREAMADIQTRTALMDSRFIAGDQSLYEDFRRDVYQQILFKNRKEFLGEIIRDSERRHGAYGGSVYLLQPNLKEGRGGLRDFHSRSWLSRVVLKTAPPDRDNRHLLSSHDFLLRSRACLHVLSGRRNDTLSFELQERVARMMGLKDTRRFLASEIMMRLLYRKTHDIQESLRGLISACSRQYVRTYLSIPMDWSVRKVAEDFYVCRGEITVRAMEILKEPDKVLELFRIYASTGKKLSSQVRDFIRERAVFFPSRKGPSRRAFGYFLDILKSGRVYDTLREMHDTGVLGRFIPEFGRLRHLVIHEPYHRYTVDEHTLIAIRNVEALGKSKMAKLQRLRDVMGHVRPDILYLSILLHDVGKAEGTGLKKQYRLSHEEEGVSRIRAFMERAGLEKKERMMVEFLVKNHILLSRFALTRDPDDPETIEQLAGRAEDEENLNALYLMTYADMSAVNPGFWTDWKAHILHDLFFRTREQLRGNRQYCRTINDPALRAFVMDMPERYLISSSLETIRKDYEISRAADRPLISMAVTERPDGTAELNILTTNGPGILSLILGVLGRKGLNVLRARFFTGRSGLVIDKIIISNWRELWWTGLEDQVREGLLDAFSRPFSPGDEGLSSPPAPLHPIPRRFESFVEIDNEPSGEYSVLEVFAPDRLGLLYDIATQIHGHGVEIISAAINTEDGIAQDVFYLQQGSGKVESGQAMIELLVAVKAKVSCTMGAER